MTPLGGECLCRMKLTVLYARFTDQSFCSLRYRGKSVCESLFIAKLGNARDTTRKGLDNEIHSDNEVVNLIYIFLIHSSFQRSQLTIQN